MEESHTDILDQTAPQKTSFIFSINSQKIHLFVPNDFFHGPKASVNAVDSLELAASYLL